MSTTNIDEQKIQQIKSSDTIKEFMEKCNNNFSNIFLHRSGPEGKQGVEGSQGVPTKPKVPIHVWREGVEYYNETSSDDGYVINGLTVNLADSNYQEGHLIMLKNGHVYILKEDEESKLLKPNYIMALQSYNQDDVIDGRSAYIHIAFANSQNGKEEFISSKELKDKSEYRKYMGIYSDYEEESSTSPEVYTWVRIVGDQGEKGEKGEKGDTQTPPTSTNVEVVGYSLSDLDLKNENWEKSISDLGELKPGTPIYIKNKYTWSDGTVTYGKTVTMAGTQGIKGETGRVLFYLGSFSDGTLKGKTVKGLLNEYRCDYYIDAAGRAWMRTGTSEIADGYRFGKDNITDWKESDKVGFLQTGAIHADMINTATITANSALVTKLFAQDVEAKNLKVQAANIQGTLTADKIKTGTISSDDGKSYFDLDNGDFVLGNVDGAALKYTSKTGTLTIGGVPTNDDIEKILTRLGVVENIEYNIEVGGRNLLRNTETMQSWTPSGCSDSTVSSTTDTLKGKDAARVTGIEGNDKYKVKYSLMEHTDEHFDTTRPYALSFNFKALNYTQCVRVNLKPNQSDESEWSEVIKLAPDEEKRISFIGYLTANTNLELCMGAEYWNSDENSNFKADFVINEMKLEYGTVATDWTPAPEDVDDAITEVDSKSQALEYLKKALESNTEIVNGLIATSSIQLRDWTGKYVDQNGNVYNEYADGREKEYKVNSGLSGIDDDNILLWGGGTYSEAVNAAISENDYHKQPGNDEKIATLIKTDGTGKIGSFEIIDNHTVSVNSSDGNSNIVISAGQNKKDTNIVINQGGDMKVLISGDTIKKNSIYGVELKGRYALNKEITASNQDIVVKEIEVPPGTGNWSVKFNAQKLMIMFGVAPLSSISGVSCDFNVYLCGIEISKGTWKKESISSATSYSQEVGFSVDLTPFTSVNFTNTDGQSTQTLEVKLINVQVKRGSKWSTDYNQKLYLSNIRICTKTGDGTNMDEDYEDDSILLTYVSSIIGIIQIGSNGIQVSNKNGGFIQILNDNSELYVRMFGLPTNIPTGSNIDGNIYNWNGFLRVAGNESTSNESTTIDLTEIGYKKVVLPSKVEIKNIPEKGGIYGRNELYRYSDGNIFINAY